MGGSQWPAVRTMEVGAGDVRAGVAFAAGPPAGRPGKDSLDFDSKLRFIEEERKTGYDSERDAILVPSADIRVCP